MSQPPQNSDGVDRLLADFFKSQMPHPWPSAPVPEGDLAEPSSLRVVGEPRRSADPGRRPRLTLAVSVALLLGALWFMSAGSTPGPRPLPARAGAGPNDLISGGSAKLPREFDRKDKEEDPDKTGLKHGPITFP
jgi:hypothetical protein